MTEPSTDLVPAAGALGARSPDEVRQWLADVQEMLRQVLEPGVDYGHIPKVEKPILLKPGAEKLALLADLGVEVERVAWEPGPTGEMGATYKATATRGSGRRVQVERYAGYDENQFLTVDHAGRLRYRAPWDTVIFMAQKRAFVGAVKLALGLSGLFAEPGRGQRDPDEAPARSSPARGTGAGAPGPRRPVERRSRPDQVPAEVYDDLPEAQGYGPNDPGRPF